MQMQLRGNSSQNSQPKSIPTFVASLGYAVSKVVALFGSVEGKDIEHDAYIY